MTHSAMTDRAMTDSAMQGSAWRRAIARREVFSGMAGAAAALAGLSRPAAAAGPTPLRVSCAPDVTGLPAWVAKERGLFERNGLDVFLVAAQHITLDSLGEADIGAATPPEVVKAWQDGVDVAAVAGEAVETRDNPITHVIVRAGSPIKALADLKGRTVGFPALGAIVHVATLHAVRQTGVDPGSVYAVQLAVDAMANELRLGNVDAVAVGEPVAGQLLAAGNRSVGDPLFSVGEEVPSAFWIARRRWSQKNPDVVTAFVAALEQARDAIAADPEGARRTLARCAGLPVPVVERTPFPTWKFAMNVNAREWAGILKDIGEPARRRPREQSEARRRPANSEPEQKAEQKAEAKPESKPEPKPEPKPESSPEPRPEPKPEPKPEHNAEQHKPQTAAAVESAPDDSTRPESDGDDRPERRRHRRRVRRGRPLQFPFSLFR